MLVEKEESSSKSDSHIVEQYITALASYQVKLGQ